MKRYIIVTAIFSFLALGTIAQNNTTGVKISIDINGLTNNEGKIMLALYDSENSFLKNPFRVSSKAIVNNKSHIEFDSIKPGTYAISCYQDKNLNQQLDFNGMGIPKEPTAASNDAKGFFGPPKFKDAKFDIKGKNKNLIITF